MKTNAYFYLSALSLAVKEDTRMILVGVQELRNHSTSKWRANHNLALETSRCANFQPVDELEQKIYVWLAPADPSPNHNAAREKCEPATGVWFTHSPGFGKWKRKGGSFVLLHGIRMFIRARFKVPEGTC